MGAIAEVVTPVFALIGLGYLAARLRWVDESGLRALTFFVFTIASPALLFSGGTRPHAGGSGAALAQVGGALLIYALMLVFARRVLRQSAAEAAVFALACVFGNSVMMGIPLVVAAYGEPGVPPLLAILAIQTFTLLGLATMMTEIGLNAAAPWRHLLKSSLAGMLRNPVILSVLAALAWSALQLPVPRVARYTMDFLGAAAPPLALFCLGGGLFGMSARGLALETASIVAVKLVLMPAVVYAIGLMLGLTPIEMAVAVTVAALPTGANAFILARRYATGADRSGAAVVVSTALSVLTLSLMIGHFRATLP